LIPIIITKVSGDPVGSNPFRGTEVLGTLEQEPEIGKSVRVYGEPLDPTQDVRVVTTSPVVQIQKNLNGWTIRTENSTYTLEVLLKN
jgi:hypothetical protein